MRQLLLYIFVFDRLWLDTLIRLLLMSNINFVDTTPTLMMVLKLRIFLTFDFIQNIHIE
jgi:hypothetical protein